MRLTALALSVLVSVLLPVLVHAGSAEAAPESGRAMPTLKAAALPAKIIAAIDAAQVQRAGRLELLYGLPINAADTDGGRLACARVVTAILRQAGVALSPQTAGVAQLASALSHWHSVTAEDDVRAGDVVIYRHILNRNASCTGGGSCHVVISVGGSRVFGNSSYDLPLFSKRGPQQHYRAWLHLAGYRFKVAYRAPSLSLASPQAVQRTAR